jgi:glycosyltransferase involved in cell wall biosynthesis
VEPIRILQVVTIMNRGGLETMLMNYYREMSKNGFQFDFLVHREEAGDYDKEIEALGGRIYRMPNIRPGNYRRYFKELDAFFEKNNRYRIVHAHMNENSSFVLRAAKKVGIPCRIMHSHASDLKLDYKYPFRMYARSVIRNNPSEYFACSNRAGEWLFGKKKISNSNFSIINNAVKTEDFIFNEETRKKVREEIKAEDKLVIGHVGRFHESKNHIFLLQVFESLFKKHNQSVLVLVGDGDTRKMIEREAEKRGIYHAIRFLGVRDDIADLLQAMDMFVFPSHFEGLPVVLIEAQAAGLRCILSDRITRDVDITGRMEFIPLERSADYWSEAILKSTYEHVDTQQILIKNGYDAAQMAKWLGDFYMTRSYATSS